MKKLEDMSLEELRVAYTTLKDEKEKSDAQVTALTDEKGKLMEDNKRLQHYNNELFSKIPNLNPVPDEDNTEDKKSDMSYDGLLKKIDDEGGMF